MNNNIKNIDPRPKRRKAKDNPYNIFTVGIETNEPHYYISFIDTQGIPICMEINEKLYYLFEQFELDDLSYLNEIDNHYCNSGLSEKINYLKDISATDSIENIINYEKLYKSIKQLPIIQQKRLKYYYFDGYTMEEIAKLENCSFQAISLSLKAAQNNLKKLLSKK